MDMRCGMMWTGEGWVMVATRMFDDLLTMSPSPEVSAVRMRALSTQAHQSLSHFRAAIGDDDALRMWFEGLSDKQRSRLQDVCARMPR
ncbi:MAG: hypothetical protein ACI8S6_000292 [Myxococcota bacterium]|jgi:hypothetical protein